MLSYLIYVSVRKSECNYQEIQKILQTSVENNQKNKITGILLYSDLHFIQYIEGNESDLKECYSKIKIDRRHKFPKIIEEGNIIQRTFSEWNMALKQFTPSSFEYQTEASGNEKELFKQILSGEIANDCRLVDFIKNFFTYG